jgi:hypothetical protein
MLPLHQEFATTVEIENKPNLPLRPFGRVLWSALAVSLVISISWIGNNGGIHRRQSRHPLHFPRRRLSRNQVRYLTLGGPSTWGLGLEDHLQAFPYALSQSVHNAAQRVGGPTLASLCTESIVGDTDVYDVIVIEFSTSLAALTVLAQRLRQRFPQATLVFVQLWSPSNFVYQVDTNTTLSYDAWMRKNTLTPEEELAASAVQPYEWFYQQDGDDDETTTAALRETVAAVQGQLYQLPRPENTPLAMEIMKELFVEVRNNSDNDSNDDDNDSMIQYTLSPEGHQTVANAIRSLVDEQQVLQKTNRNTLGSWGSGDSCQIWYETGQGLPEFRGLSFKSFSQSEKYALELPLKGGSLTIKNPFDTNRMVYLTYMTTSAPSHPNKIYPRTKVQLNNKNSVILDPYHDDNAEDRHVTRTTAIGSIPPNGITELRLDPMEQTLAPFRIVGVSLLAANTHKIPTEFQLSPEPAHVGLLYRDLDVW